MLPAAVAYSHAQEKKRIGRERYVLQLGYTNCLHFRSSMSTSFLMLERLSNFPLQLTLAKFRIFITLQIRCNIENSLFFSSETYV